MRYRAIALLALLLLLSACDAQNLPIAPTPAPTATPVALQPTDTPVAEALATATEPAILPSDTPTVEASPTAAAGLPTVTPGSTEATGSATPPAATPANNPALETQVAEVESETSKLRGLTPKKDVPENFISPDQLKSNMVQQVKDSYSPEDGKRDAIALWLMRLLDDPKFDLYQLRIDLLGERVLGFYDDTKHELFLRAEQTDFTPIERETLAHEFTHSLQDQYYDLSKIRPENIQNDQNNATLSLVEGDAVVTQFLYDHQYMSSSDQQLLQQEQQGVSSDVFNKAPAYMRDTLYFPYDQGPFFIEALAQAQPGSYKGINDALADPPQSTEQILHPEKYLATPRDTPVPVTIPPLTSTLGAGWTFQYTDTLGEFDFNELLKINGVDDPQASDGWGGASYAFYQKGDGGIVAVDSVWDTPTDAQEFNAAMQQSLQSFKKSGEVWSDGKRYIEMKMSGSRVTFVSSTESGAVEKALAAIK